MVLYYGASTNPKAPVSTSARTVSSNRRECYTKQGPNPLLVSGHFPETLQLPSRQPTMAWVLARHGSDDMSGVHVINHHRYNEQFIQQRTHLSTSPSPSHSAHTAQLGRLEKNLTDNETAQLKAVAHRLLLHTSQRIQTLTLYRVCPPRFSSRKQ